VLYVCVSLCEQVKTGGISIFFSPATDWATALTSRTALFEAMRPGASHT
jgi:hypothetical protein